MKIRSIMGAGVVLLVGVVAAGIAFRSQQSSQWPDLSEEPPIERSVMELDESWTALQPLLVDISASDKELIKDTVMVEGPPIESGFWTRVADQVEGIHAVLEHPIIVTPAVEAIDAPGSNLTSLLPIGQALCLRGWTSHASGMMDEAVDDMLAADAFGQKLAEGSQGLVGVMVGLSIQQVALTELAELLALVEQPSTHARAAAGLAQQEAADHLVSRAALLECPLIEDMLAQLGENPALLSQEGNAPIPDPGVADHLRGLRYDADATIAQHRRNCRRQAVRLTQPSYARGPEPPFVPPGVSPNDLFNPIGVLLLSMSTPSLDAFADREADVQLARRGLLMVTAARRYAFDHDGVLPENTRDLIPNYLPEALEDPFSPTTLAIQDGQIASGSADQSWVLTMPEAY